MEKVLPIKILYRMNMSMYKTMQKQEGRSVKAIQSMFKSNLHYLDKQMKKENLDPEEIEVSEERIKELFEEVK